jgi:hypothetical protein
VAVESVDVWSTYLNGLPEIQKLLIQEAESPPHLFSVISWGCAATTWLSHVLNSHPDIYCVHASNGVWRDYGGAPALDGAPYLQILRIEGRTSLAAGDVHGVSRYRVPELKAAFGSDFSAAVLIREPIARITSLLALFEKYARYEPWGDIGYIDQLIESHALVLPDREYRTRLFVHAINMLNAIPEELEVGKVFRQEDITTEPASLQALVGELSAGKVSPGRAWCEAAVRTRARNPHAGARQPFEPKGWQLDVLRKVVSPSAWRMYSELGYPSPGFL